MVFSLRLREKCLDKLREVLHNINMMLISAKEKLVELLNEMTYDKLLEIQASRAENLQKQLKYIPIPNGYAIKMV